ncbi:stimulus-sensing domain-containing protein [Radicibacter daui]|uniref:stimulus-sensing domain-containing protein n=1 Tax=Radicibacter daui TaxID=3064829 RepID=UPI004046E2AE
MAGLSAQRDEGRPQERPSRTYGARRRGGISRLTLRILAVNLAALLVPVLGALYLGEYRNELIASGVESLRNQALLFSDAVAEGAAVALPDERSTLSPSQALAIVRRLSETGSVRTRLYDADGSLIADSRRLSGGGGTVIIEELPPPDPNPPWWRGTMDFLDRLFAPLTKPAGLLRHGDTGFSANPQAYPDVVLALEGETQASLWDNGSNGFTMTVAAPVQLFKQVLGAVLLSRDSREIENALRSVRLQLLTVFAVALSVTVLLSLYLARSLARPITRLARAAERMRASPGRELTIPDFSARQDEIGHLSVALRDMTRSLWDRMDAIERFAADVAHEIKNPLTSMRSAIETATRIKDPERQGKLFAIILDDVTRLDRLITDISDASRVDAEMSRAQVEPLDLDTVLSMLVENYRATRQDGQPEVSYEGPGPGKARTQALEGRLVQVFRNLVGNAISFSPPDGAIKVRLAVRRGGGIEASVEDSGPGIPDAKLDAIFNRFYSERPAGEKFGTHSGLGLSISKQIIDALHGRIYAENRRDSRGNIIGARFVVELPPA